MRRTNGALGMTQPIDYQMMEKALSVILLQHKKPAELDMLSSKAWKKLRKIIEIDPKFIPQTELEIWQRAEWMEV